MKQITAFQSDCGKVYKSKQGCKRHEQRCMCFTNPAFRACATCIHNGGISEDERICLIDAWDEKYMIPNAPFGDCVNCPGWENKTGVHVDVKIWERKWGHKSAVVSGSGDDLPF